MIKVKVIADSYYLDQWEDPHRVTTLEMEYPRHIHSELLTHRVFSRNSASSRAIPLDKMIELVETNPVEPMWTLNQKGMSGVAAPKDICEKAHTEWDLAMQDSIRHVRALQALGIHKQNANRLLEPFQHIKTILTGTDFTNFFNLRISPEAQPEIHELAYQMRTAIDDSTPWFLKEYQVHCPYVDAPVNKNNMGVILRSVALCAQVSYRKEDGEESTVSRIINRLLTGTRLHASPFEHICIPDPEYTAGNLTGFTQLRHCIERWQKFGEKPEDINYYNHLISLGKKLWSY